MTEGKRVKAVLNARRDHFTLLVGEWRGTFPVEKLADWIRTYENLGAKRLKMNLTYDPTTHWAAADALRALQGKVGQNPVPPHPARDSGTPARQMSLL